MSLDSDFTVYLANRKIRSESYIKCNLLKYVKKMKIKYLSPFDTPRVILNVISLRFWRIWSIYTWRNAGMIRTSSDISNKLHLHKPQPLANSLLPGYLIGEPSRNATVNGENLSR